MTISKAELETLRNRWIELVEQEHAAIAKDVCDVSLRTDVDRAQRAYWTAKSAFWALTGKEYEPAA